MPPSGREPELHVAPEKAASIPRDRDRPRASALRTFSIGDAKGQHSSGPTGQVLRSGVARCYAGPLARPGSIVQEPENCTPLSMNISGARSVPFTRAGTYSSIASVATTEPVKL